MAGFLIIIILLGAFWVVAVLPRRRRLRSHQAMQDALVKGDEVITAGGLHGRVDSLGDAELRLEIADGVVVTIDRRAIAAVATDEIEHEHELEAGAESESEHELSPDPEDPAKPR